jgi:hypothetical protein
MILYVISLYFELTKVFVVCVQGVKQVNWWCPILGCQQNRPTKEKIVPIGRFHWKDLGPTSSFLLVDSIERIWVPPFLLLVDFVEKI